MKSLKAGNDFEVYADSQRSEMLRFVPASARRILEVGCSVGNFGRILTNELGATVWGVEPDPAAAKVAAQTLNRVINGHFGLDVRVDAELDGEVFDCIVFNDVLEHMVDPYSALALAKDLLTPEGSIVASIPNVRYFDNVWKLVVEGSWEYADFGILDRTHLRFFTRSSIETLFADAGLRIHTMVGINAVDWCHPNRRQLFRYLNFAMGNRLKDMRWLQFAVVAGLEEK